MRKSASGVGGRLETARLVRDERKEWPTVPAVSWEIRGLGRASEGAERRLCGCVEAWLGWCSAAEGMKTQGSVGESKMRCRSREGEGENEVL
jgi:hypothetical protein